MGSFDYKLSYRRNLPHIQPEGATFFLTFRLAGSLPQSIVDQWKQEREWLEHLRQSNPFHYDRVKLDFERKWFAKFESVLDGSTHGPVWLRDDRIAAQIAEGLRYRDGRVYRLDAFSIMANHVHAVFKPLPVTRAISLRRENVKETDQTRDLVYHSLASIMQSLKGYTAFQCNRLLERKGEFWAHESYDHYVRDAEEWNRIVAYVLNNPVKAGYVADWRDWKWNYRRE